MMQTHRPWEGFVYRPAEFCEESLCSWWLDKTKMLCNPADHWISGHGLWHLLDVLALYFVYLFYRQFDVLRSARRPT